MKHLFKSKNLYALLLIAVMLLSQSCAYYITKKKVHITPTTKGAEVSVINGGSEYEKQSSGPFDFKASYKYPLVIKQVQDGYQTSTHLYMPDKLNPWKVVDLAVTGVLAIAGLSANAASVDAYAAGDWTRGDNQQFKSNALLLAAACWPWYGTWVHYTSDIKLPKMKVLPERDSTERYLIVDKVNVDIEKEDLVFKYYNSFRAFRKDKSSSESSHDENLKYNNSDLKYDLNDILAEVGFADTTNTIFTNSFNSVKINADISSMEFRYISLAGGLMEMDIRLSLHEFGSEKELYSKDIKAVSDFFPNTQDADFDEIISSALRSLMYQFLEDDAIRPLMKSQEDNYKLMVENMEPINLACAEFAQNKQDALKAVVTIKKDKSHGSGSIISKDGYIITNLHVTGDDESKLIVVLGTGEEKSCKIIRSNPRFDLALLKIDPVDVKPLRIVVSKEIEVGEEVYAIGTPADIELGQSISKGIISGKRKNNDQVFIQTDVSVNPGNSGGALINEKGELLGVINAKLFGQGIEGIGFAIPAYLIQEALKVTN